MKLCLLSRIVDLNLKTMPGDKQQLPLEELLLNYESFAAHCRKNLNSLLEFIKEKAFHVQGRSIHDYC